MIFYILILILAVVLIFYRPSLRTGGSDEDFIIFITGNEKKCEEVKRILNMDVRPKMIDLPEIQSVDVIEVIHAKLESAKSQVKPGQQVCVEDTSLSIKSLGDIDFKTDFPGALIKFYTKALSDDDICKLHKNSKATAVTCAGFIDKAGKALTFTGVIDGIIADSPRGTNGFGWDKIFIPLFLNGEKNTLTFAEMTSEQKDSISMRKSAFAKMADHIKGK